MHDRRAHASRLAGVAHEAAARAARDAALESANWSMAHTTLSVVTEALLAPGSTLFEQWHVAWGPAPRWQTHRLEVVRQPPPRKVPALRSYR